MGGGGCSLNELSVEEDEGDVAGAATTFTALDEAAAAGLLLGVGAEIVFAAPLGESAVPVVGSAIAPVGLASDASL